MTRFKFEAHPRATEREQREKRVANTWSVVAGFAAFLTLGAGWPILIAGILTYMFVRLRQQRRQ